MPPVLFLPRTVTVAGTPTTYRIFVPQELTPPVPVILFLHGSGESGSDGLKQTTVGLGPWIASHPESVHAIVVMPQASRGYGWRGFNLDAAIAALDDVEAEFPTDPERVSVSGISMGGYGAWLVALVDPSRFSAVVPICGGLDRGGAIDSGALSPAKEPELFAAAALRLRHIPQWAFHGTADDIIPVGESRRMVGAVRDAGGSIRYTEYPGVGHNSWDRAYAQPELVPWMLTQKRRS